MHLININKCKLISKNNIRDLVKNSNSIEYLKIKLKFLKTTTVIIF